MKRLLLVLLALAVLAVLVSVAGVMLSDRTAGLAGARVLTLRIDDAIEDYRPVQRLPFLDLRPRHSLATIYRALARARDDDDVEGLAVYVQSARFGLGTAQELRSLFADLRAAGKAVDCYLETAGEGSNGTLAYYLVSGCDNVSLAPAGDLNLLGLYLDSLFLRGTLDKLEIEPEFAAVGRYKSAAEVYTRSELSEPAREALAAVLDDLFGQLVRGIAADRGMDEESVRSVVDGAPYLADEALDLGLVDRLEYPDEFAARLAELAGGEDRLVPLASYDRSRPRDGGRRIAVVFAQGTILRGAGGVDPWTEEMFIGSDDLGDVLERLTEDEGVEAVVLRVDSPGGSALASDLILRGVALAAREKPVIVSMSDVAASGGYYIAARARRIVASPATVTGSIGVLGGKLVTRRFQQELLGVTHDTLARGSNAGIYSTLEEFTPEQEQHFQEMMRDVYDTFVGHVAEGRGMTVEEVDAVAQGRIWSGTAARERGLVDELGGLGRAVELAADEIGADGVRAVRLEYYPRPPGLLELLQRESRPLGLAALLRSWHPAAADLAAAGRRGALRLHPRLEALAEPF